MPQRPLRRPHGRRLPQPKRRQRVQLVLTEVWKHHPPKGLVGIISRWNYPLTLGFSDALPAIVAGNAVLAKPDDKTPFSALWALRLLERKANRQTTSNAGH